MFTPPPPRDPPQPTKGFTAGVLTVEWTGDIYKVDGKDVYVARVTDIDTHDKHLNSELAISSLKGLVVRSPDGHLSKIRAIEHFLMFSWFVGEKLGLLLESLE